MKDDNNMRKVTLKFKENTIQLFDDMKKTQEEFGLKRINSIILLKGLLEEKQSILYDFLCATSQVNNPYKQIINDCDEELRKLQGSEQENDEGESKFSIKLSEGDLVEMNLSRDVYEIVYYTVESLLQEKEEEQDEQEELMEILVDSEDIFVGFMNDVPKDALKILKNNGVYIEAIYEYYSILGQIYNNAEYAAEECEEEAKIPKNIADFVTVLSAKYKGVSECEILGRDKECKTVMRILQKRGRKNAILIGEAGVGKTAIAEKIAYDIANGNCPESLKESVVMQLNVNSSVAGTMYRGMAEERFKLLVDYLEKNENVILFIDEMHTVIGAGSTSPKGENDMSNALKPFLASKKARVIGATTKEEYERIIATDDAFKRRFQTVNVKEPKSKEVYPMLKNAIKEHEKFHGVKISKEMVEYAVLMSSCFNYNTRNPDRTNDLIDTAMVIAKEQGKNRVDKECILENFDINFEKYAKMEKEDKLITAYHETGHYLVWRLTGTKKNKRGIAVSIMPTKEYEGVTVFDDLSDEVTIKQDRQYLINELAELVAGIEAEKMFTSPFTTGPREDLDRANKMAYDMITHYSMGRDTNVTYIEDNNYHMMSEEIRNKIDKEKKDIIDEATNIAKKILRDNKELVEKMVKSLLKKGILEEKELDKICS